SVDMTVSRPPLARLLVVVSLLVGWAAAGRADDSPGGRVGARVVPVNNRVHATDLILGQMVTKPGKPYDENTIAEDVRRLLNTKWFAPGGVRVDTAIGTDGQVTVFVHVIELNNIVREVVFLGYQHLNENDLYELSGLRRGSPLNPATNQLAAMTIQNKLREDGRYYASVHLVEGDKLSDERVVFHVVEGPVVRVNTVEFLGNKQAPTGRLKTQVSTTGALIPGHPTLLTAKFTPMVVEADKQKLLDYYHRLGYLEARIREEVIPVSGTLGMVNIVYHIHEGVPFNIRTVRIDGTKAYTEDRIKQVCAMKPGDRYDKDVIQADVERVKTLYGNTGVNAAVNEELFAVPGQAGLVDVHYRVLEPGREADRVGRIIIEGNTVTDQRVILNQLRLYPGQVLQYPKLREAEANLARLGIFDGEDPPQVVAVPTDGDSPFKDIRVRVKETRTGMVALAANVNSNAGLSGTITVNQRNFDILRFPTSFDDLWAGRAFRGGGQELRLEAMPGTQFSRYSATWREPYLFDTQFGLTNSAYYFNRFYAEYNEDRLGARATVDYRFQDSPIWKANGSVRIEGVNIKDPPQWATKAITDDVGYSTVLGLRGGLNRDTRDSYLLPTSGSVLDFGVEQVLGSYSFPIGTFEGSIYQTVAQRNDGSGKQIVAMRSQLSVAGDEAPVFERFYAGGFRSLRGFTFRGVGPFENQLNVGGTFSFLNTVEYQVPLMANDKVYLVGFVDHGTVESGVKITDYRVSVGFGLRLVVPALGPLPIALDFAFPLMKGPSDNQQMFSFYVGWFGGQ
ncbi:MAG: outer membrane protein assembly factor BamA, partial [Fimbriiglobus sp.]